MLTIRWNRYDAHACVCLSGGWLSHHLRERWGGPRTQVYACRVCVGSCGRGTSRQAMNASVPQGHDGGCV
jgi:hypothetical protein